MISFWVNQAGSRGIRRYADTRGRDVADRVRTRIYEEVGDVLHVLGGAQIFTAIDQLTGSQRELAAWLWDSHARLAPAAPRLNDPRAVLLRFELLTELYARGLNVFRVYPAAAAAAVSRFPVFVRQMSRHNGPRTGLLESPQALARALRGLRFRGYRRSDLMITEYCDTSDRDGVFRKYAAYKVGEAILPCHVFRSHHWCAKSSGNAPDDVSIREEAQFVQDNPHREWLERVFAVARIDYGRVDYGVLDGVPQVWEINLNPTLGSGAGTARHAALPPALKRLREDCRRAFHRSLQAAFVALDESAEADPFDLPIDQNLRNRLQTEIAQRERRERAVRWMRDLPDHLRLARPLRAAYTKVFPRG